MDKIFQDSIFRLYGLRYVDVICNDDEEKTQVRELLATFGSLERAEGYVQSCKVESEDSEKDYTFKEGSLLYGYNRAYIIEVDRDQYIPHNPRSN